MEKVEKALELFNKGSACSQAVFSVFTESFGLDPVTAHKLSAGFGAGIARRQMLCGAFSGGAMVLGLKEGSSVPEEREKKELLYTQVNDFFDAMQQEVGGLLCSDLLGVDLNTPQGKQDFEQRQLKEKVCNKCVAAAIQYLEN